jgi:hypothetical protein
MVGVLVALWTTLHVQAPDSAARARYEAALRAFGDSLTAVEGAEAKFQADLIYASTDLVVARATRLRERCAGALSEVAHLDSVLPGAARIRGELRALQGALARCDRDFAVDTFQRGADSIKAWAPYRLAQLRGAVLRYRIAAHQFMRRSKDR